MSFADLRQRVLRANTLGDAFGETVQIGDPTNADALLTVRAKVEMGQAGSTRGQANRGTFDERQRIRVTLSRDASREFSYPGQPQIGTPLRRSVERDPDERPYTFRGEVLFAGDQHAVYVFERPRRVAQGKGS